MTISELEALVDNIESSHTGFPSFRGADGCLSLNGYVFIFESTNFLRGSAVSMR
jgi:hypothetical protein